MLKLPDNEYDSYYKPYVDALVESDKSILENLEDTQKDALTLLANISKKKQLYRYADGKWTVKELVQHLIDTERVMAYRALRFARRDATDLAGFEVDDYVENSNANTRDYNELLEEFLMVRKSTILLFKNLTEKAMLRIGSANGSIVSVRALGYIISGHLQHHINIIKERYLQ